MTRIRTSREPGQGTGDQAREGPSMQRPWACTPLASGRRWHWMALDGTGWHPHLGSSIGGETEKERVPGLDHGRVAVVMGTNTSSSVPGPPCLPRPPRCRAPSHHRRPVPSPFLRPGGPFATRGDHPSGFAEQLEARWRPVPAVRGLRIVSRLAARLTHRASRLEGDQTTNGRSRDASPPILGYAPPPIPTIHPTSSIDGTYPVPGVHYHPVSSIRDPVSGIQ